MDGLKTCRPRKRIRYFDSSEIAAVPAKIHHPCMLHQSPCSVPGTRRMNATPFPVSRALAGHMITCCCRKVIATSSTAQVRRRDQDLGDREAEVERHLSQDLQRDDHAREVQAGVAQGGQQHRVIRAAEPEGPRCRHRSSMAGRRLDMEPSGGVEGTCRTRIGRHILRRCPTIRRTATGPGSKHWRPRSCAAPGSCHRRPGSRLHGPTGCPTGSRRTSTRSIVMPYRVTDAMVAGLAETGADDDAVFEISVASAFGAADERLDAALQALRAARDGCLMRLEAVARGRGLGAESEVRDDPAPLRGADARRREDALVPAVRSSAIPSTQLIQEVMRGPSEWTVGERELFAAFVSERNRCVF